MRELWSATLSLTLRPPTADLLVLPSSLSFIYDNEKVSTYQDTSYQGLAVA